MGLAIAQMTTSTIATCDHGIVTRTKRVIMDRDVYEKKWKLGPFAKKKADLKEQGLLDKYGRMKDNTPEAYKLLFGDVAKATSYKEVADQLGKKMPAAEEKETKKPSRKSSNVEAEKEKKPKRKSSKAAEKEKKAKKEKKEGKEKKDKKEKKKSKKVED